MNKKKVISKQVAIFNPYFDSLGGGEVYTASVAKFFLDQGFSVDIFWKESDILDNIDRYLGIDIRSAKINVFNHFLFSHKGYLFKKWMALRKYDYSFFVSDGSIPFLFAKKNYLHLQVPFSKVKGKTILNYLKFNLISKVITNSNFTREIIMKSFPVWPIVIYPPINIKPIKVNKQNLILSVGRFTTTLHNKRQDILIEAMKSINENGIKDWRLRIAGNTKDSSGKALLNSLRSKAKGLPVDFLVNISHRQLEDEYNKASIFWHAAGYGIDENEFPEKVEHFGISTAEAMIAGCAPVVINKGGLKELIVDAKNGYLWNSLDELVGKTIKLIINHKFRIDIQEQAANSIKIFSKNEFYKNLGKLI